MQGRWETAEYGCLLVAGQNVSYDTSPTGSRMVLRYSAPDGLIWLGGWSTKLEPGPKRTPPARLTWTCNASFVQKGERSTLEWRRVPGAALVMGPLPAGTPTPSTGATARKRPQARPPMRASAAEAAAAGAAVAAGKVAGSPSAVTASAGQPDFVGSGGASSSTSRPTARAAAGGAAGSAAGTAAAAGARGAVDEGASSPLQKRRCPETRTRKQDVREMLGIGPWRGGTRPPPPFPPSAPSSAPASLAAAAKAQVESDDDFDMSPSTTPSVVALSSEEEVAPAKPAKLPPKVEGKTELPPGWTCDQRISNTGKPYKAYRGPDKAMAQSIVGAWRVHEANSGGDEADTPAVAAVEATAPPRVHHEATAAVVAVEAKAVARVKPLSAPLLGSFLREPLHAPRTCAACCTELRWAAAGEATGLACDACGKAAGTDAAGVASFFVCGDAASQSAAAGGRSEFTAFGACCYAVCSVCVLLPHSERSTRRRRPLMLRRSRKVDQRIVIGVTRSVW